MALQPLGHQESPYERPNQKWVCGRLSEGCPCKMGPDNKGRCTAAEQSVCQPRKEGDRWLCSRSQMLGGACEHGPLPDGSCCRPTPQQLPCQPKLTVRAQRQRVVVLTVAFLLGILLIGLGGPWFAKFINPGELTSAHMAIASADGAPNNCGECHSTSTAKTANFDFQHALGGAEVDSAKCMQCHFDKSEETKQVGMQVHNLDPTLLAALTKATEERKAKHGGSSGFVLASLSSPPAVNQANEIQCAVCHKEHKGMWHDITKMSDVQCQSCHADTFASFNDGHPQFTHKPYERAGINFDHNTHQREDHFGKTPFECSRCHISDSDGKAMQLLPFAQSCGGCHNQGKRDHHGNQIRENGVVTFQLPEMEFEEPDDVYWPVNAALNDQPLSPLVLFLLAGDDKVVEPLLDMMENADGIPIDWEPDEEDSKVEFASAMKRLIKDLSQTDKRVIKRRIQKAAMVHGGLGPLHSVTDALGGANFTFMLFQRRWMPELAKEAAGGEFDNEAEDEGPTWDLGKSGGWKINSEDAAVVYRVSKHSDSLVRGIVELMGHRPVPEGSKLPEHVIADSKAMGETPYNPGDDPLYASRLALKTLAFKQFAMKGGEGPFATSCRRCHTLDSTPAGMLPNWFPIMRDMKAKGYAKFNHRPHMAMLNTADSCSHCHKFSEGKDGKAMKGFAHHQKETCTQCHAPGKATNSCLNCHQYHFQRPNVDTPKRGPRGQRPPVAQSSGM